MDSSGPEPRLLIVSGDYDACDELTRALARAGYAVDFAYDSQSALDLARRQCYDATILDHWPPFLNAVPLARHLRRLAAETAMVLLADSAESGAAALFMTGGGDVVLPRSADVGEILDALTDEALTPCDLTAA